MKKLSLYNLLSTTFVSMYMLSSCSNNKLNVLYDESLMNLKVIDKNEISLQIDNKNDFILFITISTCATCQEVKTIINEYIEINHRLIYQTDLGEVENNFYFTKVNTVPAITFFKSGELLTIKTTKLNNKNNVFNLLDKYLK